jgi:hypothetical protein
VAAFLSHNGVAEAFHQLIENLDFLCHANLAAVRLTTPSNSR